jgi:hypothetical protein
MTYPPNPQLALSYAQRDPSAVEASIEQQLPVITNGAWQTLDDNDLGTALIKTLIYLNYFGSFFVDAALTQTFLSTLSLREAALRKAGELGYPVATATPATCELQLTFPPFGYEIDIAANSSWSIGGVPFVCTDPIILPPGQTTLTISVQQGTFFTQSIVAPGTNWFSVVIPPNAAQIVVSVDGTQWTNTTSWVEIAVPTTYKRYETPLGQTISFATPGVQPPVYIPQSGQTITINAVLTLGAAGNINTSGDNAVLVSIVRDPNNGNQLNNVISAVTLTAPNNGLNSESVASIQQNAPAYYGAQGRAVTASDWVSLVKQVPGVQDALAIGGETLGNYSYVYVTLYGNDPYTVDPDLLDAVNTALTDVDILCITPIFIAPNVLELTGTVTAGISRDTFSDAQTARNQMTTALNNYIASLPIGASIYISGVIATLMGIPGIVYIDASFSVDSFATSRAGILTIPLVTNPDVSNCTLKDGNGNTVFTGNGTQYLNNGNFNWTFDQDFPDETCYLYYNTSSQDILLSNTQVPVLVSLTTSAVFT